MRTLFLFILSTVFFVSNLIAPNVVQLDIEGTESAEESEFSGIISRNPNNNYSNNTVIDSQEQNQAPVFYPAATPTPIPVKDPEILFGEPKVTDTFERGSSGFGLSAGLNEDEGVRIIALNNRLSLEPQKNNGWINWRLRPPSAKNIAAEMEFSITTCARGDRMGIMMHATDYSNGHGYYFSLSCEGTASILRDSTILGSVPVQGFFNNNSGDVNIMTALVSGETLTLLLNGNEALSVQDSTYPEGFSGFFTAPQNQNTLTLDISSYKLYY